MLIKRRKVKRSTSFGRPIKRIARIKGVAFKKKAILTYTGSPDSVEVANLLDQFNYRPAQEEMILKKYEKIVNGIY